MTRDGRHRRFSLLWQLELAAGGLLLLVVAVLATAAYLQVRSSTRTTAEERLRRTTSEVATALGRSFQNVIRVAQTHASAPAVAAYLSTRDEGLRAEAVAAMTYRASRPEQVAAMQLFDARGNVVLSAGPDSARVPALASYAMVAMDTTGVGHIAQIGDTIVIPFFAPVRSATTAGRLVLWLRVSGTLRAGETRAFLGSDAGVWSDLRAAVSRPAPADTSGDVQWYARGDSTWLGMTTPLPGSPLLLHVESSARDVLAPATLFLRRITLLAILLAAISLAAVGYLSRRIIKPLRKLTSAAQSFSDGNYAVRVEEGRRDELGSLAVAFNTMAERVHASHDRLSAIVEAAPVAIYSLDSDARVTSWNSAAERIFGWSEAEVIGRTLPTVSGEAAMEPRERLKEVASGVHIAGTELTRVRKDGRTVQVRVYAGPLHDESGAINGAMVAATDVTDVQRLEQHFRQSQKMEAVGRLAGGVAHDFNNLLTVILGECNFALEDIPEEHPARSSLQEIGRAGRAAAELTGQLLAFSRQKNVEPTTFSLDELITETAKMLRRLVGEDITVMLNLNAAAVPVRADRGQFQQVIINLAVNARDAMPKGGMLTIATAVRTLTADDVRRMPGLQRGEHVLLSIVDTGTGIPEDVRARIFEPFFTTKEVGQGTGLGLAMCYSIVTQANGRIEVYSEIGLGTTFAIYLPRAAEVYVRPPAESAAHGTGTGRILLVEDQETVRNVAARILGRAGYDVVATGNAEEALAILGDGTNEFDLLLSDVVLPGMKGGELAKRARELRPELKVVFASGYTSDAAAHQKLIDDDAVLVHKPFTAANLTEVVRSILELNAQ